MLIKYPPKPEPIRIEIEPTNVCNANCTFCTRGKMKRPKGYLDLKKFSEFLDRLDKYRRSLWLNKKKGAVIFPRLVFAGLGEPTLHPRIIDIVAEGSSRGFNTEIVTNGISLTLNLAQKLAKAGLCKLSISLHSLDPRIYHSLMGINLDKVLPKIAETLEALDNTNVDIELWRVGPADGSLLPELKKEGKKYKEFLSSYKKNIKVLGPTPAWNRGGQLKVNYWPKVHDSDEIWCQLLYFTLNITWDGTVIMCCCDYSQLTSPLGNAWNESLRTLQKKRNKIFKSLTKELICQNCRRPRDQTYEKNVFPILNL